MERMDSQRSPLTPADYLSEIADLAGGLGILLLPLFPLALPIVGLVLVPLALLGLVGALAALPLVAPILLVRALARRRTRAIQAGRRQRPSGRRVAAVR
jgi:membrane protein implicated in regulation of membrane protease activity